jgi:hypothetical protein
MSPQVTLMCEAILALTEKHGTFTTKQIHAYMGAKGAEQRSNLTARLTRLVRNDVVRITNENAIANGAEARFAATSATVPYMHGDRDAFNVARECPPQPVICDIWGIRFPDGWHNKRYPNARVHKPRWD